MENEKQIAEVKDADLVIFGENGRPTTTSLVMAERFEKLHKDVLRKIENLDCSGSFRGRNFTLTHKKSQIGVATRTTPMYEITKDGFSYLAMGFTGKKAAVFKERFIEAFNAMEKLILDNKLNEQPAPPVQNPGISVDALSKILADVNTNMIDRFGVILQNVLDGHSKTIKSLLKDRKEDTAETDAIIESATKKPIQETTQESYAFQECGFTFGKAAEKAAKRNEKLAAANEIKTNNDPSRKAKYFTVLNQSAFIKKYFNQMPGGRLPYILVGKNLAALSRKLDLPVYASHDDKNLSVGLYHEKVVEAFKENVEMNRTEHLTHNIVAYLKTPSSSTKLFRVV